MLASAVNTKFVNWLIEAIDQKGWSQSELARQASLTPSAITDVFSGRRNAGMDFCNGIAQALNLPRETVYRVAGLLPPDPASDQLAETGLNILRKLTGDRKTAAVRILEAQLKAQEEVEKSAGKRKGKPSEA